MNFAEAEAGALKAVPGHPRDLSYPFPTGKGRMINGVCDQPSEFIGVSCLPAYRNRKELDCAVDLRNLPDDLCCGPEEYLSRLRALDVSEPPTTLKI